MRKQVILYFIKLPKFPNMKELQLGPYILEYLLLLS